MKKNTDLMWSLSLFGTAIGAGVLFLPIAAGITGMIPIIFVFVFLFPIIFLSHRALCQFVISSPNESADITSVADDYFGKTGGAFFNVLYLLAILPILYVYSVGITNTVHDFALNQFNYGIENRALLSFCTVGILIFIVNFGQDLIIRLMSLLVYPFILILMVISIWMIKGWNFDIFMISVHQTASFGSIVFAMFMILPVLIFSFNHSPIISSLAVHAKKKYGKDADQKSTNIIALANILMIFTVALFVFSSMMCLTPDDMRHAKQENISILTYLANHFNNPLLSYIGPIVAIVAMGKSYFGHYLGSKEGVDGMICKISKGKINQSKSKPITISFVFISCWLVAYLNPNILDMIDTIGGLVLATILFIMPIVSIYKIKALNHNKSIVSDVFILSIGVLAIISALYVFVS
jgi:serine transporter